MTQFTHIFSPSCSLFWQDPWYALVLQFKIDFSFLNSVSSFLAVTDWNNSKTIDMQMYNIYGYIITVQQFEIVWKIIT